MSTSPNPPMYNLSPDDLSVLADPLTEALVERHLGDDPTRLALRWRGDRRQGWLVCRQVKYLQRARSKLPAYYAARCILPPLAYEQSSGEAAAALKRHAGALCIDLTCGLGVDSLHFSRTFGRVIALERDAELARVARHNFARLGAGNITVENTCAEEFLAGYDGPTADLIYVDPARRSGGERVFLPEECSPNVLELKEPLLQKARKVLIKLSPLFDIDEAFRVFSPNVSWIRIVSTGGEVREVLVELEREPGPARVEAVLGDGRAFGALPETEPGGEYLLAPDAAFYKARFVAPGFVFAADVPPDYPGRVYRILETIDYQPQKLKKYLRQAGVKRINLLRKNFPHTSREILRALNVGQGGNLWLAFTAVVGKPAVLRVEPVG